MLPEHLHEPYVKPPAGIICVALWTDRTGRFSALKFSILLCVLAPAAWLAYRAGTDGLGSRPITEAIHQSGDWAIRFLAATMAVTPLRRASRASQLILVRRMLGLSALAYALLHFSLYILDQHFNFIRVTSEIALRIYLTIGFAAFCGLCLLGATSTDAMIKRLGSERWNALHQIIFGLSALAVVHFFMQSKLDVTEPILMGGVFCLLIAYRLASRFRGDLGPVTLAALALLAAVATAIGEAAWYGVSAKAPFALVLAANLDFSYTIRPAWFVLGVGALVVAARVLRPFFGAKPSRPKRSPGAFSGMGSPSR
jgi:sulfoxide reductase heme-binding subunit YedZ